MYELLIVAMRYRPKDIGRPKAEVAAEFVNGRISGAQVTPYVANYYYYNYYYYYCLSIYCRHYAKIQDFPPSFYKRMYHLILSTVALLHWLFFFYFLEFHIIVCGLDSVAARRWINGMAVI